MTSAIHDDFITQALRAAGEVARRLGVTDPDPVFLHQSQHVSVLLRPIGVVARMLVVTEQCVAADRLCRELAVARHLAQRQAPIVAPSEVYPAGPHFQDQFGLTLWPFVEHTPADGDDPAHVAHAAVALRRVHEALADYPGELPSFMVKIDECRTLLERPAALPALAAADRAFLLSTYDRIMASMGGLPCNLVPIHGDAGPHNVFITPDGARYSDFEDVSLGPREWDLGRLADVDLAAFEPVNRDLLAVLADLRSLCVSVWCWGKFDVPVKRDAAEFHLGYLRERFG